MKFGMQFTRDELNLILDCLKESLDELGSMKLDISIDSGRQYWDNRRLILKLNNENHVDYLDHLSEKKDIHDRISKLIKDAEHRVSTDDGIYKTFPIDKLK